MYWVRLWHGMPTEAKWRTIAKLTGQPVASIIAVFTMMMLCAVNTDDKAERGRLKNWRDDDAAAALDLETDQVQAIREAMEGRVLRDGLLTGWEGRQPLREDSSTARVQQYRARNALKRSETLRNAPETETYTETDKNAETDKSNFRRVTGVEAEVVNLGRQRLLTPRSDATPQRSGQHENVSIILSAREKDDFEEWFKGYIKPVRKASALQAYGRALRKLTERIGNRDKAATILLRASAVYAVRNKSNELKYEPGPEKWLDEERWTDGEIAKILAKLPDDWKPGDHFLGAIDWYKVGR